MKFAIAIIGLIVLATVIATKVIEVGKSADD